MTISEELIAYCSQEEQGCKEYLDAYLSQFDNNKQKCEKAKLFFVENNKIALTSFYKVVADLETKDNCSQEFLDRVSDAAKKNLKNCLNFYKYVFLDILQVE